MDAPHRSPDETRDHPAGRAALPPGQRRRRDFPRFAHLGARPPAVPAAPELAVTGAVTEELRIPLAELDQLVPRVERVADFHCVAGWSATGLRWSGVRFRDFWEQVVLPRGGAGDAVAIVARGGDGVSADLDLRDALADDVLLADRLDGAPLGADHGAPLRLVSPGQYGFKNVKHLAGIEIRRTLPDPGKGNHLRARVALEERHPRIDGRLLRLPYRMLIPLIARLSRTGGTGS
ncbi:molybdopterin-dependent oxidoreductase [Pseudonocardia sp. C8]|uniref:molybdopterin-dependent oxidoreductase n=1 Tax=Pseudonocardia sp. C8 TaxID=2762759 RepID=UPI001642629C|nr:molybdopterin-dependent oxidoreductase [Pseudonocardia sp. C8]MBC3189807.1 molybdopterin-dependent oxidoreductase [Pseudonocardia sp. C8]